MRRMIPSTFSVVLFCFVLFCFCSVLFWHEETLPVDYIVRTVQQAMNMDRVVRTVRVSVDVNKERLKK